LLQLDVIETQAINPTAIRTNFKEDTFMSDNALICFWYEQVPDINRIKPQNYFISGGFSQKNMVLT